jgi:hypothetical protein
MPYSQHIFHQDDSQDLHTEHDNHTTNNYTIQQLLSNETWDNIYLNYDINGTFNDFFNSFLNISETIF